MMPRRDDAAMLCHALRHCLRALMPMMPRAAALDDDMLLLPCRRCHYLFADAVDYAAAIFDAAIRLLIRCRHC